MDKAYVKAVEKMLIEYPNLDKHIERRREELLHPYKARDVNSDIKSNKHNDVMTDYLITLEFDKRLNNMKKTKQIIDDCLKGIDEDMKYYLNNRYFKKPNKPVYIIAEELHMHKTTLYRKRDRLLEDIAIEFGFCN